jgi:hypothetical protein
VAGAAKRTSKWGGWGREAEKRRTQREITRERGRGRKRAKRVKEKEKRSAKSLGELDLLLGAALAKRNGQNAMQSSCNLKRVPQKYEDPITETLFRVPRY